MDTVFRFLNHYAQIECVHYHVYDVLVGSVLDQDCVQVVEAVGGSLQSCGVVQRSPALLNKC